MSDEKSLLLLNTLCHYMEKKFIIDKRYVPRTLLIGLDLKKNSIDYFESFDCVGDIIRVMKEFVNPDFYGKVGTIFPKDFSTFDFLNFKRKIVSGFVDAMKLPQQSNENYDDITFVVYYIDPVENSLIVANNRTPRQTLVDMYKSSDKNFYDWNKEN